jgi:hypothetical protein
MVTQDDTGESRKVVFRGGVNIPSGRRWPHRWNATIPSGRLTISPQRVMLWSAGMANVIAPTFSASRDSVQVSKYGLALRRGLKFVAGEERAYFWRMRRTKVLQALLEYGYKVEQ